MSSGLKVFLIAFCFAAVMPPFMCRKIDNTGKSFEKQTVIEDCTDEHYISVLDGNGCVVAMSIEDYVIGVVLREMPAEFSVEALKAQAIVARTYALRHMVNGGKHVDAAVCMDSACCQGFQTVEAYTETGGFLASVNKIKDAVLSVENLVLTYEGVLIDATYFSCSGGVTEDAVAVWGTDIPYLQSVSSPGEEFARYYTNTDEFSAEELASQLGLVTDMSPDTWVGNTSYTDGRGVEEIQICGKSFTGTQIRNLLNLRSAAFSIAWNGTVFVITTSGYGHRVGMSQYGAEAMARTGATYDEILCHYYRGVKLSQFPWND